MWPLAGRHHDRATFASSASPAGRHAGSRLIVLTLITLVVVSAFTLSSSNLKAVGNMQARDESVAAADQAIELVISSAFTDAPVAQEVNVDINKEAPLTTRW